MCIRDSGSCWATAKSTQRQGTAVKKDYQKKAACATMPVLPQAVTVALAELAGDVQEGLLAMAVGTGLQVMAAMMSADLEAGCGPKGKHDPTRTAVRHGSEAGSVTLGGRRVPVARPRMRAADGSGELAVASYLSLIHISEPTRLGMISYAVFCLKK